MSESDSGGDAESLPDVPVWDDEYVDRVSDRLMHSYDLERDRRVEGHTFTLYGRMEIESRKQFIHPSITYGNHETTEHLFARRDDRVRVADLERLADLADELADAWIEPDEEHFATEFVFAFVVPEIPEEVRDHVANFESRTLLKHGFYGHYSVRMLVVAPDEDDLVASPGADVATAFRLWDDGSEENQGGLFDRLRSVLSRRS